MAKRKSETQDVIKKLEDAKSLQLEHEKIANIPTEFDLNGKTVRIKSKGFRALTQIDSKRLELRLWLAKQGEELDSSLTPEEQMQKLTDMQIELYRRCIDIIYLIVNDDPDNPQFSREELFEHIGPGSDNIGLKILQAFEEKNSTEEFFRLLFGRGTRGVE